MKPRCNAMVIHYLSLSKVKSRMLSPTAYFQTPSNPALTGEGILYQRLSPLNRGLTKDTVPEHCNRIFFRIGSVSRRSAPESVSKFLPELASNG